MDKILRNITASAIDLFQIGLILEAGQSVTLAEEEYLMWATEETISEVSPFILSGDIVVNNGTIDLSPADGVRFLKYAERSTIQQNDIDVTQVNTILNFEGDNVQVIDEGNGKSTVKISDDTSDTLYLAECAFSGTCHVTLSLVPLVDFTLCFIKDEEC